MNIKSGPEKVRKQTSTSSLSEGNKALRSGDCAEAASHYLQALQQTPELGKIIAGNLKITQRKFQAQCKNSERKRVAVCGWELAHNAAGRVYTLAKLYETFAEVEIIGSIFHKWGRELWEPIRNTTLPHHTFVVEDESRFLEQAMKLVAAHPYDIVHLSKPRMPNIFFGLLYKLVWGAKVLVDIDDEELAFVGAETSISIDDYIKQNCSLPELKNLPGKDWTRIAVGLAQDFDGITVSNPALKKRYEGLIIPHVRDEKRYIPSSELRYQSRNKFGIPLDKKVVLFFGTPREHKGLEQTARALAKLERNDVWFVIIGNFPNPKFRELLLKVKGVHFHFIGAQSFERIPEVVAVGDYCVLLQDPHSVISQFQVPAKLTDALAMGLKVFAQSTSALEYLAAEKAFVPVTKENLANVLANELSNTSYGINRDFFLKKLSCAAFTDKLKFFLKTKINKPPCAFHDYFSQFLKFYPIINSDKISECVSARKHLTSSCKEKKVTEFSNADIVICVHNAIDDVRQCLNSLIKSTDLMANHLILVDDGSNQETRILLLWYAIKLNATYIRNETPRGYTRAANQGITASSSKFIVLLNSDTVTTSGWLNRLVSCAESHPFISCVGPLSNAASWQSIPYLTDSDGKWMINELPRGVSLEEYASRVAFNSPRLYPSLSFINGFCLLITRSALDKIGLLDEETFPRGYGEEDDFCLRALEAGFENLIADDCYIFHAKSKSFTPEGRLSIVKKSKNKLSEKYTKEKIINSITQTKQNEELLKTRTWAGLAGNKPVFSSVEDMVSQSEFIKIGWLQPHLNCVGGIRRTIEMSNRLVSWGHKVCLITPDGVKSNWLPIFADVLTVDQAKKQNFDIVILSDPDMVEYLRYVNAKNIINYHLAAYMLYRKKNEYLTEYYSNDPSIIHVANSSWTAEQVRKFYDIEVKGIFPGGVDKRLFRPHPERIKFDIVCYGSNRPHKGTKDIQAAAGKHSLLKLKQLNLLQKDLSRQICTGKIFVSGCWHEGFNFCPLEAMSCGVPVVTTDCGGSREYAIHEENALVVPPGDIKQMAKAIDRLLNDTSLRLKLIENGLKTAWKYEWNDVTMRFSGLITNVIRQRDDKRSELN